MMVMRAFTACTIISALFLLLFSPSYADDREFKREGVVESGDTNPSSSYYSLRSKRGGGDSALTRSAFLSRRDEHDDWDDDDGEKKFEHPWQNPNHPLHSLEGAAEDATPPMDAKTSDPSEFKPMDEEKRVKEHLPKGIGAFGYLRSFHDKSTYPEGWYNERNEKLGYTFPVGLKGPEWFESTAADLVKKMDNKDISDWRRAKEFSFEIKSIERVAVDDMATREGKHFLRAPAGSHPSKMWERARKEKGGPLSVIEHEWKQVEIECEAGRSPLTVKNDICMQDFNKPLRPRIADLPGFDIVKGSEYISSIDECPTDGCRENVRYYGHMQHAFSPKWFGKNRRMTFKDVRGRNAVQCSVVVKYRSKVRHQHSVSDFVMKEPGIFGKYYERAQVIGVFRAYPFDMMREADEEGFVKIPIYAGSFQTQRSRGWGQITGVPFYIHCGKFASWAKVKFTDLKSSPKKPPYASISPPFSKSLPEFDNREGKCPLVFAHRGVVDEGELEHSVDMSQRAYDVGISGVEADVFLMVNSHHTPFHKEWKPFTDLSKYQVALTHDGNLRRMFGGASFSWIDHAIASSGNGGMSVWRNNEDVLSKYGRLLYLNHHARYMHCEPMPTLSMLLGEIKKKDIPVLVNLDVKPSDPTNEPFENYNKILGVKIGAIIRRYGLENQVMATGFNPQTLKYVNYERLPNADRHVRTGLATWDNSLSGKFLSVYQSLKKDFKEDIHAYHLSRLKKIKKKKISKVPTGIYTVYDITKGSDDYSHSDEVIEEAVYKGVTWIETDDPIRLQWKLKSICEKKGIPLDWYPRDAKVHISTLVGPPM